MYFLNHSSRIQKFLTVLKLLSKRCPKVTFQHIFWAVTTRKLLATNVHFTQNFISRWLITWYRTNICKPNSRANRLTSIFTPPHRHIIGIRFSGNSVGHIQRTITLLISTEIKKICVQIQALNMYFLKHSGGILKFLVVLKLLSKRWPKVTFQHIFLAITARE